MNPEVWAELRAGQTAWLAAQREAEAEKMARLIPVTDAEIERYRDEPDKSPERAQYEADLAEVDAHLERIAAAVRDMPDAEARSEAEKAEYLAEPGVRPEPQAEAALEPVWTPGTDSSGNDAAQAPEPVADVEAEIEM